MAKVSIIPEFDKALFERQVADISAAFARIGESFDPSKNINAQIKDMEARLRAGGFDTKGAASYARGYESDKFKVNPFNERATAAFEKKYADKETLGVGGVVRVLEEIKASLALQTVAEQQQAKSSAEQAETIKKNSYAGRIEEKFSQRSKTAADLMNSADKDKYFEGKRELEEAQKERADALGDKKNLTTAQMIGRLGLGHYLGQGISVAASGMGEQTSAGVNATMNIGQAAIAGSAFGVPGAVIAGVAAAVVEVVKTSVARAAQIEQNYANSNKNLRFGAEEVSYGTFLSGQQKEAFANVGMSFNDVLGAVSPLAKSRGTGKNSIEELYTQRNLEQGLGLGSGDLSTINSYARNEKGSTRSDEIIINLANMLDAKGVINGAPGSSFDITAFPKYLEKLSGILDRQFMLSGKTDSGAAISALGTFMSVGGENGIFKDERVASQFLSNTQNVLANPQDDYQKYLNNRAATDAGFTSVAERAVALEEGNPAIGRKRIENSVASIKGMFGSNYKSDLAIATAGKMLKQYAGSEKKGQALYNDMVSGRGFGEVDFESNFSKDIVAQQAVRNTPSKDRNDAIGENIDLLNSAGAKLLELNGVMTKWNDLGGGKTLNDLFDAINKNGGYRSDIVNLPPSPIIPAKPTIAGVPGAYGIF